MSQSLTRKGRSEFNRNNYRFWGLVKVADRLAASEPVRRPALAAETFEAAQWAQSSEAAASLAQMGARGAAGDPKLATLVRERQDLVAEWQKRDAVRSTAVSQSSTRRDMQAETTNVARLAGADARIAEIDNQLANGFPDYAALVSPKPLSVAQVQSQLRDGEALVLFLDTDSRFSPTPEETFIWVVSKTDSRWVKIDIGTEGAQRARNGFAMRARRQQLDGCE